MLVLQHVTGRSYVTCTAASITDSYCSTSMINAHTDLRCYPSSPRGRGRDNSVILIVICGECQVRHTIHNLHCTQSFLYCITYQLACFTTCALLSAWISSDHTTPSLDLFAHPDRNLRCSLHVQRTRIHTYMLAACLIYLIDVTCTFLYALSICHVVPVITELQLLEV
jgi:hypothetical protein